MNRSTPDKIKDAIIYSVMIAFLVYAAIVGWWLLYPYEPITVERPIKILNQGKSVKVGETLLYEIKYNKHMAICGTLSRKLINNTKIDLSDSKASAPIGEDKDIVPVLLPTYADPGTYYLWWSVSYKVNPLRTVTINVESEKFEVIK